MIIKKSIIGKKYTYLPIHFVIDRRYIDEELRLLKRQQEETGTEDINQYLQIKYNEKFNKNIQYEIYMEIPVEFLEGNYRGEIIIEDLRISFDSQNHDMAVDYNYFTKSRRRLRSHTGLVKHIKINRKVKVGGKKENIKINLNIKINKSEYSVANFKMKDKINLKVDI